MARTALKPAACALALLIVAPAAATPPDIVDLHDELFGIGLEEVLVLRTVTDNMGLHAIGLSTVFLAAIDGATGEETLWPLYRARFAPDHDRDPTGNTMGIETWPLTDPADPFAILTERKVVPAGTAGLLWPQAGTVTVTLDAEGLSVSHDDGASFHLPAPQLAEILERTTGQLAELAQPYSRPNTLTLADLLAGRDIAPDGCTASEDALLRFPAQTAPIQLVRITCGDPEEDFTLSRLVVVPQG